MLIAPGADGLLGNPTFGYWTTPKYDDTVNVECHASKWGAPPGSIAELEGYGPADGRWITTAITREKMKSSVTVITLGRGKEPTKEPAHEVGTRPSTEATGEAGTKTALAAFNAASTLSSMQLPYTRAWGHGPQQLSQVKKGSPGLDCSSSTSWVLHEAGMFPSTTAQVSGELENWGEAGEGKEMTVWANADHVWIEFKIPGHAHARGDTVSPGSVGFRLQSVWPPPEGTANFTPRHWPGT